MNFVTSDEDKAQAESVEIPENITYFNKITYAPFGSVNLTESDLSYKIFDFLQKKIPNWHNDSVIAEDLAKQLKNAKLAPINEKLLQNCDNEKTRAYSHSLSHIYKCNPDYFYESIAYDAYSNKDAQIMNKKFELNERPSPINDTGKAKIPMGIYVAFENGKTKERYQVDSNVIENENVLDDYEFECYTPLFEDENGEIKDTPDSNISEDGKYVIIPETTTAELLKMAETRGYEQVVMIDYTCDVCTNMYTNKTVPRNLSIKYRQKIRKNPNRFGRGGGGGGERFGRKTRKKTTKNG